MVRPDVATTTMGGSAEAQGRGWGAGQRANTLTRQFLSFARREGGGARRVVTRPHLLDINTVVYLVREMLLGTLGDHIELSTSLADGLWPVVADRGQFEQVLVNLVVNARDAMPVGGVLTIDTANIVLDSPTRTGTKVCQRRNVRLRVSDTGTGMTRDVVAHIFEPFYTTGGPGAAPGLGLATVHGIVAQAGGQIQVYSRPGIGTTFTVSLPASTEVTDRPADNPVRGHRFPPREAAAY